MKICIFEDSQILSLSPVNILRHSSQMICGALNNKEKIEHALGPNHLPSIHTRKNFYSLCKEEFPGVAVNKFFSDDYLFLNSRIIYSKGFLEGLIMSPEELRNTSIMHEGTIVAFHISKNLVPKLIRIINSGEGLISPNSLSQLNLKQVQLSVLDNDAIDDLIFIKTAADLVNNLNDELMNDMEFLLHNRKDDRKKQYHAEFIEPAKIIVEQNCRINRNVVLDASSGGIYISKNTTIEPFTFIKGPVYIGEGCTIRSGSKLYGPLTIGDSCKVSGEITNSIFHSHVNKQHLGFVGHSYVCEWVNLGAGTTTSNLKNNYSRISLKIAGKDYDSGSIFLGSIIGDHTKTGISTMLNSGTIVGIMTNLFGTGFHSKAISSFSWADASGKTVRYDPDKAINTAKISMGRRNVKMSPVYENYLKFCYKNLKKA